jgi:hypothetical protein
MAKVDHLDLAFTQAAQPLRHQATVTALWVLLEAQQANARRSSTRENLSKSVFPLVKERDEMPREGQEVHPILEGLAIRAGITKGSHVQILDTRRPQSRRQLGLREPSLTAEWDVTDVNNGFDSVFGKGRHPLRVAVALISDSA